MLLRFSCKAEAAAQAVEKAVEQVLLEGYKTVDIADSDSKTVSCSQMAKLIAERI